MSINGVGNSGYSPLVGLQSEPATVSSTTTGEEETAPLVGIQDGEVDDTTETAGDALVPPPDPDTDPLGYNEWVENTYKPYLAAKQAENQNKSTELQQMEASIEQIEDTIEKKQEQIEDLEKLKAKLQPLVDMGDDPKAAELIEKLDETIETLGEECEDLQESIEDTQKAMEKLQEEIEGPLGDPEIEEFVDEYADLLPDGDNDGDGQKNSIDVDDDNDKLLDTYEISKGLNTFTNDTDGDGINDLAEDKIMKNVNNSALNNLANATNADANNNGVMDGAELQSMGLTSAQIKEYGTAPQTVGNTSADETPLGDDPAVNNEPVQWYNPGSDAHTADFSDNKTFNNDGKDTVITLNGPTTAKMVDGDNDGKKNDLVLKNNASGKTITIKDYLGADGKPQRKVFLEGEGDITYQDMDPSLFDPVVGSDGFATAGVNIASDSDVENSSDVIYDPMDGAGIIVSNTPEEIVYNASGSSGPITLPKEFSVWEKTVDGDDVTLTGHHGDKTYTIVLQGGKQRFENYDLWIQLSETSTGIGQKITAEGKGRIEGSKGKDKITGYGMINGNDGSDYIEASKQSTVHGGAGDDFIFGSQETDTLYGDAGMDFIYSGAYDKNNNQSKNNDTLDGGTEADVLIVGDGESTSAYHVKGGIGSDTSNFTGANSEDVIEVNQINDLNGLITKIEEMITESNGAVSESLQESLDNAKMGQAMGANTFESAANTIFQGKAAEFDALYGEVHDGTPPPSATPPGNNSEEEEENP